MTQEIIEGYRVAPQQERLFLLQADGTATAYRARCVVRLAGDLDARLLEAALALVVWRHEILRTAFQYLPGMSIPVQVITEHRPPTLVRRDLSALPAEAQARELAALLAEADAAPFALSRPPLEQLTLACLAPAQHALLLNLPALYADRAGLDNFVRELSRAYEACARGEALTDEPLQYADLAAWQHELLESEETEVGREYWRQQNFSGLQTPRLAGARLCEDPAAALTPQLLSVQLDAPTRARIESYCRQQQTTTEAFLLACWQTLLWRHTDQPAFCVGVAFSGRAHEDLGDALGLFTKHLPLQAHVEQTLPFSRLVAQVAATLDEAAKWQDYFAWQHVAAAQKGEMPGLDFGFEHAPHGAAYHAAGLRFSLSDERVDTEHFNLKLCCTADDNALRIELHYDARRYEPAAIQSLLEQYQCLLQSAAATPDSALVQLSLLSAAEREQVVTKFNRTAADYGTVHCLHELFAQQAARTPAAPALISEDTHLTYAELDARANQLARYLRRLGVGPEVRVGLCVDRSVELVVALLAVLKAGGAYLPLDPQYPQERLAFMLADSAAPLLLTTRDLAAELPTGATKVLYLDAADAAWTHEQSTTVVSRVSAANLAYVIYTSGSTGRPKGVEMTHAGIANRLLWMHANYPLGTGDRVLQKTAVSFDASIWELFAPWLGGAAVVLARAGGQSDPGYLVRAIQAQRITTLQLVPSMLQVVVGEAGFGECRTLKHLWCGGEAFGPALRQRCEELLPWVELHNLYGPTEAAIDATHWHCVSGVEGIVIGRPIGNVQVYVLDAQMEPVPVGVAGELYIGGAGLARGYLRRPDLTAARFVPDPFSTTGGGRLYRTGDIGRHLPDGQIEFLGRADNQLKLRGYRIELGEIEAALTRQAQVREAAVVARAGEDGEKRLVAYVVPRESTAALSPSELRGALKAQLPEYMLPSSFVILDKLPRTPNGKLDLKSLPTTASLQPQVETPYVAPRTEVEQTVADIWRRVLQVEQVGVNDNFFDLGGHSLLVLRIHRELQETFRRDILMTELFQYPTVSALAAYLSGADAEQPALEQSRQRTETRRRLAQQQRSRRTQRAAE